MTILDVGPDVDPAVAPDVDPAQLSDAELAAALLAADRKRSVAEARQLRLLAEFDARQVHAADGELSAGLWLARRGDVSRHTANVMVRHARKLRSFPESFAVCPTVGTARVREMLRRVNQRTAPVYRDTERLLLSAIADLSVDDTARFASEWQRLVDADGPEPADPVSECTMGRAGDALHGSFTLFADDAALLTSALDNESDAIYRAEGDTHLTPPQRRAAALMNLIRAAVGADPRHNEPARPTIVVHITLADLESRSATAATVDPYGAPISPAAVRRLLCDADLHRFVTGPDSVVLDLGRSERLVKSHQRLAVIARDRHCTFPGCDRPPSMCHAHHITPWEAGGASDLENLALLCSRHHHLCHEGGFTCARGPDGTLEFRRPDGSSLKAPTRAGPA